MKTIKAYTKLCRVTMNTCNINRHPHTHKMIWIRMKNNTNVTTSTITYGWKLHFRYFFIFNFSFLLLYLLLGRFFYHPNVVRCCFSAFFGTDENQLCASWIHTQKENKTKLWNLKKVWSIWCKTQQKTYDKFTNFLFTF